MKHTTLLLFILLLAACQVEPREPEADPQPIQLDIDLSNLQDRYIDLAKHPKKSLLVGGTWKGDRLVWRNASGKTLFFANSCRIETTHAEDAMAFDGNVSDLTLQGGRATLKGGGITFWGELQRVKSYGFIIGDTHTGWRATKPLPHTDVLVDGLTVVRASNEGVYIGASQKLPRQGQRVSVKNCAFERIGWDAVQVGNTKWVYIENNTVNGAGLAKEGGQDYGITSNHCNEVFITGNKIGGSPKIFQETGARIFIHE